MAAFERADKKMPALRDRRWGSRLGLTSRTSGNYEGDNWKEAITNEVEVKIDVAREKRLEASIQY